MLRKSKRLSGNALIEFALVLPILILIIAGIIDFSFLFYDNLVITNASREGARYGIVAPSSSNYPSMSQVIAYTETYCNKYLLTFQNPTPSATVKAVSSVTPPTFGATLTVTVDFVYEGILLYKFISQSQFFDIGSTTTMLYE